MPLLSWFKRDEDLTRAALVPYRLLEPVAKLSYGEADSPNMLIEGDNLDALKALLPYYAGQVKCVFIDPPYNTKSAFEQYDDNIEHAKWLSMMYPRIELLRALLAEDGSIWISIDDNEGHYLKVMMDEIFGRKNFVANAVWQKKYTVANDSKWLSENHDHILVYAVDKDIWRPFRLPRTEAMDARYRNPDRHPKGPWKATPLYAKRNPTETEKLFSFTFKNGVVWTPPASTSPRFPAHELARMDANDEIWFGKDGKAIPSRKTFLVDLADARPPTPTVWLHGDVGHNHQAREEAKAFNSAEAFATPKPEKLIARILELSSRPGDLVLDSFLGSGTTAAVAQKMGRRWIGIEMGNHARTHCVPRLRKAVDGEQGGISSSVDWHGGGGFRFYKLGPAVFDDTGHIRAGITFELLAAHVWFAETGVARSTRAKKEPFLGVHDDIGYYLLFNGILGDETKTGGNVLTKRLLRSLPAFEGPRVIYGEACMLTDEQLADQDITFRQTPYDLRAR